MKDLIKEAVKLANDIDEYLPNSNISDVIRRLVFELERTESEKNRLLESQAKSSAG